MDGTQHRHIAVPSHDQHPCCTILFVQITQYQSAWPTFHRSVATLDAPADERRSKLSVQRRITFARDVDRVLAQMAKVCAREARTLDPDNLHHHTPGAKLLCLQCPPRTARRSISRKPPIPSPPQNAYLFLRSQDARQRQYDLLRRRSFVGPWKNFGIITDDLHRCGLFEDMTRILLHVAFMPHDLLIDITNCRIAHLFGPLDRDEFVFAPTFLNCQPLCWL